MAIQAVQRGFVKAVLLAGGFGSRLNAICDPKRNQYPLSKPACPVGNLRTIGFNLSAIQKLGIKEAFLATHHLPESISRIVGEGETYGFKKISYVPDSAAEALDTAGSVSKIVMENEWHESTESMVLVLSADIIHNVNLEDLVQAHIENQKKGAVATIVVNRVPWDKVDGFGTVALEGMPKREDFNDQIKFEDAVQAWFTTNQGATAKIMEFKEKAAREQCLSSLNNSSLYIFNASFFKHLFQRLTKKDRSEPLFPDLYKPGGATPFSDWGKHVFKWLTEQTVRENFPMYAYVLPEEYKNGMKSYWRDAGLGEELRLANMDVLNKKLNTGLDDKKYWTKTEWGWRGQNVYIDPRATIDPRYPSIIGDNVRVEEGVKIVHSVIGPNTIIEKGAQIYGTVIFPQHFSMTGPNIIGAGAHLIDSVFTGGIVSPNADYHGWVVYSPQGGSAIDSLFHKTEIK